MTSRRRSKTSHNAAGGGGAGTPPPVASNSDQRQCKAHFHQLHQVLRTLVFFCDGMSWSYILPTGPTVLFRWFQPTASTHAATSWTTSSSTSPWLSWRTDGSVIYHYLESVVAVYVLGRCLGKVLCKRLPFLQSRATYSTRVTRVVTATLFVHVFAAGLMPERFTVVLRLVTAILAGMLCGMTSIASLGEVIVHAVWNISTATKTYWVGFLTCVLLTSFIRAYQAFFMTPLTMAGAAVVAKLILSPLFLTGLAEGAEIILRFLFAFTPEPHAAGPTATTIPQQISTRPSPVMQRRNSSKRSVCVSFRPSDATRSQDDQRTSSPAPRRQQSSSAPQREDRADLHHHSSTSSSFSSLESTERAAPSTSHDTDICVYRHGKCVYPDGSPAYVPRGDNVHRVPANFREFHNHDDARAKRAWMATQEWRRTHDVWRIHTLPNRWFPRIKRAYPHFVHGHSRAGYLIVYEQPGRMRLKELFRSGCQIEDMIFHYQFLMEFFSNVICTRQEVRSLSSSSDDASGNNQWGLMVVMDVQGFGLSNLSKDVLSYLKQAGEVNKAHYPLCTKHAFIVNTSYFLAGAWSGLKGILPDTVQVDILSESKYLNALREYIDDDQIPPEYGGTSPYRLGEHPYEVSLRQLVQEGLDEGQ